MAEVRKLLSVIEAIEDNNKTGRERERDGGIQDISRSFQLFLDRYKKDMNMRQKSKEKGYGLSCRKFKKQCFSTGQSRLGDGEAEDNTIIFYCKLDERTR